MKKTYIFAINGIEAFFLKKPPRMESENSLILTLADSISDSGAQATVNWIRECYGPTPSRCKISVKQAHFGITTSVQEFANCSCIETDYGELSHDNLCDQTIILKILFQP
jgi:hypothetical protein